ncbi:MAG: hypothetical protein M3Z04_17175 [Chloroflexota bacterium]|nr:hypothetical protein [Chloroflexota bacterium]
MEESFIIHTTDPAEQVFAFYSQHLPQYGWLRVGGDTNLPEMELRQIYTWHSNDSVVEWDVIAMIERNNHKPNDKIIELYKDPQLDQIPMYPNARIQEKSDAGSGGHRSLRIVYQTKQDVATVTAYYQEKLPNIGWITDLGANKQNGPFINSPAGLDRKQLKLTFMDLLNQGTLVTIDAQELPFDSIVIPSIPPMPTSE